MTNLWTTFEASVAANPQSPALMFPDRTISFSELHALALDVANRLSALGVGRGDVVALHVPKRVTSYALLLACLRIGAPYVFLDTRNPDDRTARILATLRPALLVSAKTATNPFGLVAVPDDDGTIDWPSSTRAPAATSNVLPTDPAYVMFTSGSTGEPKGAVIPHMGVLSLMRWARDAGIASPGARFTGLNPLHFDNSVFDIYCGLLNGATLIPIETSELTSPAAWVRRIRESAATVMFAVPTLFLILDQLGLLTPAKLSSVRIFQFGGEGFPIAQLSEFYARFAGQARLINVYGPTETSCICSSAEITPETLAISDTEFPTLGRMHPDFSYKVLDENHADVAHGATGELWIGGPCVGLGYFSNPDETTMRFVQDPRQPAYRSVFYRTGDLVQEDGAHRLWFRGRADNQVKVRGHRIDLEEIDLVVQSVAGISRALAAVFTTPEGPEIGVVFMADRDISAETVRAQCNARLPHYMRPSRMLQIAELPRNANNKVDRKAVKVLLQDQEDA